MKKLMIYLINYRFFSLKFIKVNLISGKRALNSLIVTGKRTRIAVKEGACINIKNGFFYLNKSPRIEEKLGGLVEMSEGSSVNIENTFAIYSNCHIILMPNSKLNLGSGYINRGLKIRCYEEIHIGFNVAISEDVTIWDSDGHEMIGKESQMTKAVYIGNNVWIGNNVTILKGVRIGDGAIVAAGSLVNKSIPEKCLAGGVPAKVIRKEICWK